MLVPCEQQRRGQWATARGGDGHFGVTRDLALAAGLAQLHHRFMGKAEAVEPSGADLATGGVQRQFAIARDAGAAFDELMTFALFTKAEAFEPGDGEEGEAVVKLHGIDILGPVVGFGP